MSDDARELRFRYTNWRGVTADRRVIPERIFFGTTTHHGTPQWIMVAYDLDKRESRSFALSEMLLPPADQTKEKAP
jgi:predicted DNA-binding transcriptional regulator YafY